ncbi:MAG: LytTR family DNA-binding domain-containing protein [Bacteroidota bacterium]
MKTYCIVDDEPIAHRIIEGYCAELAYLKKAGNAYNVFEASKLLFQQKVDLVFLDINMPKMTGFEWLKTVTDPPKIIVTSAYKEFALEGYELDIVDYLLKPFSFSRFLKAVNKMNVPKSVNPLIEVPSRTIGKSHFFLKGDKQYHQIHLDAILFVEALGNYTKVHLKDGMIISHEKISGLEILLPKDAFLRVHKSFIVSTEKIERIQGNRIYLKGHKIPIGQTYKSKISDLLSGSG